MLQRYDFDSLEDGVTAEISQVTKQLAKSYWPMGMSEQTWHHHLPNCHWLRISLASCDCFARQKNETSSWRSKTKSTLLKAYIPWVHLHILNLLNLKAFAAMGHIHSLCSKQSRCFPLASSATNFWEKVEKTLLKRHGESGTQERSGKLFSWRMAALLLRGVQWKVSLRKKHSPRGGRPMRST